MVVSNATYLLIHKRSKEKSILLHFNNYFSWLEMLRYPFEEATQKEPPLHVGHGVEWILLIDTWLSLDVSSNMLWKANV